jgi:hypothetical protein
MTVEHSKRLALWTYQYLPVPPKARSEIPLNPPFFKGGSSFSCLWKREVGRDFRVRPSNAELME